jgi:hypothetical protein
MTFTHIQKISLMVFIVSLLPAFWIANWRYDSKLANLNDELAKQQALHLSTDKLLANCEKIAVARANPYDATHQICDQGLHTHERTEQTKALLIEEKVSNETMWFVNFALTAVLFNFLAFIFYRMSGFLKREAN